MKVKGKYTTRKDGEWFDTTGGLHKLACCHCGLIHLVRLRVTEDGRIEMQLTIDKRATAQRRRHMKLGVDR
jgi:hypothetical protein